MGEQLIKAIYELQDDEALSLVKQALYSGEDPDSIMADCQQALGIVGDRFSKSEYFLPELIMSGETVKNILDLVRPQLTNKNAGKAVSRKKGKIVLGTVEGDVHNIGKDIVGFLLDANGFAVHDLGVDVPKEKFVEAIKEGKPEIVALSGLLTPSYDSMKATIAAIETAGLRNNVRIMIGGGTIDEFVKGYVGADAFGMDAMAAVYLARQWTTEQ